MKYGFLLWILLTAMLLVSIWSVQSEELAGTRLPSVGENGTAPMKETADKAEAPTQVNEELFRAALQSMIPLTPEQIKELRLELDRIEQATDSPLMEFVPISRSMSSSLNSGEPPADIAVFPGWLTSLTFADRTGQPWPVHVVSIGNPDAYDVKSAGPEGNSNIVTISARQAHVHTNLSVLLVGAKVPLLFTLRPMSREIDYRIDIRVDQRGPNATPETVSSGLLPDTNDSTILSFLDGVPPAEAVPLTTQPSRKLQAWKLEEAMYVRTNLDLLSPAYTAKHSNSSGVKVFVLAETPVLLVADGGRTSFVNINP